MIFVSYLEIRHRYSIDAVRFVKKCGTPYHPSLAVLLTADWTPANFHYRVGGTPKFEPCCDWTGLVVIAVTFQTHSTAASQIAGQTEAPFRGPVYACSLVKIHYSMVVVAAGV
ncbi:hypothetical protein MRX96_027207 [Rhipicephalus microplus]